VSFSLTSAGSPAVPRLAEGWIRGTALGALDACVDQVDGARIRALELFAGASGRAYSIHTTQLLLHLQGLRAHLVRAADLFGSYADRLVAHETLLAGVRARALAAGLEVAGDLVLPPQDPLDLVAGKTWSDLAGLVADEQHDLLAWVSTHLEGAVESFADESLVRWVLNFLQTNHGTLVSGAATITLRGLGLRRLGAAERFLDGLDPAALDRQGRTQVIDEVGRLVSGADQLDRLGRLMGPVGITYDTILALEGDEPAGDSFRLLGGTAAGSLAPLVFAGGPALWVGTVAFTLAGSTAAEALWDELPQPMQDSADEIVGEVVDGAQDLVSAGFDEIRSWG